MAADITLPGSTFLETPGTRCNFEGRVLCFNGAVTPPSGKTGREVLDELAAEFGLQPVEPSEIIPAKLGEKIAFYWNTGEDRHWDGKGTLIPITMTGKASSIQPPLTHSQNYRKEIREVGTERFRVL